MMPLVTQLLIRHMIKPRMYVTTAMYSNTNVKVVTNWSSSCSRNSFVYYAVTP